MASGSSGRAGSGSKGFDFASDDILCSYDEFSNQESSNGTHSDPASGKLIGGKAGRGCKFLVLIIWSGGGFGR
ncbi:hypothetical protein CK203_015250 [Vitis vinifera]|uniref:Uncharacterized protein n=1 Tax=Vitis vinifera TaxID=29760 RepID=A0A438EGK7_VITVI|nr:hypothetical protein CK203_075640 [Vitis vinifera]RVX09319.1 hypothetical protein CK203_015250 [Vitis vinifera]